MRETLAQDEGSVRHRRSRWIERLCWLVAIALMLPQIAVVSARTLLADAAIDDWPVTDTWSESRLAAYRELREHALPSPIGRIRLGADGTSIPIFSGTAETSLTLGAGHLSDTAPLNGSGNAAIAGHRDGFFRSLRHVEVGDVLRVDTADTSRRYRITDLWIVKPADVWVLDDTAEDSITLITCHPFYFAGHAPDRFIVRATAVGERPTAAARVLSNDHQPETRRPT